MVKPPSLSCFVPVQKMLTSARLLFKTFSSDDTDVIRKSLSPIDEVNDAIKAKNPVEAWRSVNKLCVFLYVLREKLSCELLFLVFCLSG